MVDSCVMNAVAQKYAKAFFNMYGDAFDVASVEKVFKLSRYLRDNRSLFAYFNIPSVSQEKKKSVLVSICQKLGVPQEITFLIEPLFHQRRIELFSVILCLFVIYFRKHHGIVECTIFTSRALSDEEKDSVKKAFCSLTKATALVAKFIVDENLIEGMRIQSNTMLWESSIAQQLNTVEQSILQRVRLW